MYSLFSSLRTAASSSLLLRGYVGLLKSPSHASAGSISDVIAGGGRGICGLLHLETGGLGVDLLSAKKNVSAPYAMSFRRFFNYGDQRDFESQRNSRGMGFESQRNSRSMDFESQRNSRSMDFESQRNSKSMDFVRGIMHRDASQFTRSKYNVEQNPDVVNVKMMKNNTFVNVTDSKGNVIKDLRYSIGSVPDMKGGGKLSRYAAEATAELAGRMARDKGIKSVVVRMKGFTYFKKKRQVIMSFKEGFAGTRTDLNPIVYIEDVTRRPHNGCRLPKRPRK